MEVKACTPSSCCPPVFAGPRESLSHDATIVDGRGTWPERIVGHVRVAFTDAANSVAIGGKAGVLAPLKPTT